ncbi:hypothetical protein [Parvicella tangerina]|uniref:Uncharacterized protein n=1 Tax=Parvicella tangerina TaxID=2829795 RepID=A0A916NRX6_9FLAO|nr:hypothetical protein [Parvicella tangerina]CAG5082395.1 hypothetical protein CRYO30217_01901 [Parvicella tangerina]
MIKSILLISGVFLSSSLWCQFHLGELMDQQFYIEPINLKQRTEYIVDSMTNDEIVTHIERYNSKGYCYEERFLDHKYLHRHIATTYEDNGWIKHRNIVVDDSIRIEEVYANNLLRSIKSSVNWSEPTLEEFQYDVEQRLIQKTNTSVTSDGDTSLYKTKYKYSAKSNYEKYQRKNSNSDNYKSIYSITNNYDELGRIITYSYYDFRNPEDSVLYETRNYGYTNGNLSSIEYLTYQGFGIIDTTLELLYYDKETSKLDSLKTKYGDFVSLRVWERDEFGNLIDFTYFKNGITDYVEKYKYDEMNNVIEKTIIEEDTDTSYTFFYLNLYR